MRIMVRDLTYRWRFIPPFPNPFPLPPDPTLPPLDVRPLVITAEGARVPQDGVTPWDMVARVWCSLGGMMSVRNRRIRNRVKNESSQEWIEQRMDRVENGSSREEIEQRTNQAENGSSREWIKQRIDRAENESSREWIEPRESIRLVANDCFRCCRDLL